MRAIEEAAHLEILGDAHRAEHVALLRHEGEAEPADVRRVQPGDVAILEPHMAGSRPQQPGDQLEQRRLAGAVRADQGDDLARLDPQRRPAHDLVGRAVAAAQVGDLEEAHLRPPRFGGGGAIR